MRNGPAIAVEGLREDAIVDDVLHLMINAFGKGDQKSFLITGSETPRSILDLCPADFLRGPDALL
ncbi:hypothetical protein ACQ86N_38050 [Puia sp. P3]|uniref:hypothetical protein n=1 Tax=Puia sp. P3 TaxID=3423952 RepID=UPI003D668D8F